MYMKLCCWALTKQDVPNAKDTTRKYETKCFAFSLWRGLSDHTQKHVSRKVFHFIFPKKNTIVNDTHLKISLIS